MPLPPGAHQVRGQKNLIRLENGEVVTRSKALAMGARLQGYSSEYERLKSNRIKDKAGFWKPRAIRAINELDWENLYVDDGDPNRIRFSDRRYDDIPINYNPITPERVLRLGERVGYDVLTKSIREKIYLQELYWEGVGISGTSSERRSATERWLHRPQGLPDWFWWYHGIFS
jgi:hypothetical protein